MPAPEEVHLLAAIVSLSIIDKADLLLSMNGACKVPVGVESKARFLREFFPVRK
jgi:hypothetical protein